jgi:hypothetical protein
MSSGPSAAGSSDGPIFLVGAPRSGTTLLRAMLNRHPRLALCDETFFFYWVAARERVFGDLADAGRRARAVDRFLETRRVTRLGLDLAALRDHLRREATSYPRFLRELLAFYARAHGKARGGEKTPQHALVAEQLLAWYPDARLVHLVRDPRDVVASLRRMPWGSGSVLGDARTWRENVAGAERGERDPRFVLVKYESLIAAPQAELERLCAALGERFDPKMLEAGGGKTDRWWFDRAQGAVDRSRVEKWRTELRPDDVAIVEWVAGERLARYGYAPAAPPASALLQARARAGAAVAGAKRRLLHVPALWYRWLQPDRLAAEEAAIDGKHDPAE